VGIVRRAEGGGSIQGPVETQVSNREPAADPFN
jgi:hypothetical protein